MALGDIQDLMVWVSQSCSPKYSCKEICSPKWLPKTSFQSGSRKLFRKIIIESFPPKLHSKAVIFQKFVRNCRARLLPKLLPNAQQNCSPKLLLRIIPNNYSPDYLKFSPKIITERNFPKLLIKITKYQYCDKITK